MKKYNLLLIFTFLLVFIPVSSAFAIDLPCIGCGSPVIPDYDSRLSLFDGFENSIPVCGRDLYITDAGFVTTNSSYHRICLSGTRPNISTLVEYAPYVTRFEYKIKNTDTKYYYWVFSPDKVNYGNGLESFVPYISSDGLFVSNSEFYISLLPESGFITTSDGNIIALKNYYSTSLPSGYHCSNTNSLSNTNTFCDSLSTKSVGKADGISFVFNNDNPYFDISIKSNYDLYKYNGSSTSGSSSIISGATTKHEFDTDIDISIPTDYYLLLVPKKTEEFSSIIWTDSNFVYEELYYDRNYGTYSKISAGAVNEIGFGAMGGFNWINWKFTFSSLDLSADKVITIYNHRKDANLNVKLYSSDFYYRLMYKDSSEFCVGDICYKNNYDKLKNDAYSSGEIKNSYSITDYDDGISFIKNIPNLFKDFSSTFVFLGTLFTLTFSIFSGIIANYFYIIFGLMIIMLIIKILK